MMEKVFKEMKEIYEFSKEMLEFNDDNDKEEDWTLGYFYENPLPFTWYKLKGLNGGSEFFAQDDDVVYQDYSQLRNNEWKNVKNMRIYRDYYDLADDPRSIDYLTKTQELIDDYNTYITEWKANIIMNKNAELAMNTLYDNTTMNTDVITEILSYM